MEIFITIVLVLLIIAWSIIGLMSFGFGRAAHNWDEWPLHHRLFVIITGGPLAWAISAFWTIRGDN